MSDFELLEGLLKKKADIEEIAGIKTDVDKAKVNFEQTSQTVTVLDKRIAKLEADKKPWPVIIQYGVPAIMSAIAAIVVAYITSDNRFQAASNSIAQALSVELRHRASHVLNEVSISKTSDADWARLQDLKAEYASLKDSGLNSPDFERLGLFVTAMDATFNVARGTGPKHDYTQAAVAISKLEDSSTNDVYYRTRAKALRQLIQFRVTPEYSDEKEYADLQKLCEEDTTLATNYNLLGILLTNRADSCASGKEDYCKLNSVEVGLPGLISRSLSYYNIAYSISPSRRNLQKKINNEIWAGCILARAMASNPAKYTLAECRQSMFDLEPDKFLKLAQSKLEAMLVTGGTDITPSMHGTLAEVLCTQTYFPAIADAKLVGRATDVFITSVQTGRFPKGSDKAKAMKSIQSNALLAPMTANADSMKRIADEIDKVL